MPRKRRYPKLTPRERALAKRLIPQEREAGFRGSQAVAVGISRARAQARSEKISAIIKKYLPKG